MTQLEKCEALTEGLDRHHIEWHSPKKEHVYPQGIQFVIRKPHIHVIACQPAQEDGAFNVAKQRHAKAFFVRDGETMDFIMEKMRNCLHGYSVAMVRKMEAEKAQQPKRKRQRIHVQSKPVYEKVSK